MPKPFTIATEVTQPRQRVFEFLVEPANRPSYMSQMLTDWEFSGPAGGVGAKARARANTPGSQVWSEFEIVEAEPDRIVETAVTTKEKVRTRGAYRLTELPDGGTGIEFELSWQRASRLERVAPPIARAFARRPYGRAVRRIGKALGSQ